MLMDFIASCTAVVDDAFFKQRIAHGKSFSSELRCNDTVFPVEIDIRQIDSGYALVLIGAEDSFVIYGDKAFKLRPELTDFFGETFQNLDSGCAADRKDDNVAKGSTMLTIEIGYVAQAVDQRLTRCDDIADQKCASRNHRQLAVLDFQSCDFFLFKDTLT